jgi:hypothetical protein
MKAVGRPGERFARDQIESEIEEELRFHLELLTQEHLQRHLSPAEAKDAALKRFGNVEQIRDQCVRISRSGQPLMQGLKAVLVPVFLAGVLVRVCSTEIHFMRMGDLLIFVAILGRLLVYLRSLNPSSFRAKPESSSALMLNDKCQISMAGDRTKLTPIERVISDK